MRKIVIKTPARKPFRDIRSYRHRGPTGLGCKPKTFVFWIDFRYAIDLQHQAMRFLPSDEVSICFWPFHRVPYTVPLLPLNFGMFRDIQQDSDRKKKDHQGGPSVGNEGQRDTG